jgi:hypothetical protein
MTEYQRLRPSFVLLHVTLGGFEAVSALLFLLPCTFRLGMGQWRGDLVLYTVAVLFVATHGLPIGWRRGCPPWPEGRESR